MNSFFRRFGFAFQGVVALVSKDKNMRIHFCLFGCLIFVSWFFQLSLVEWAIVLVCSCLVICFEALNTILEHVCDYIQPERHPSIKFIKDAAAGVVLLASIFSSIVACIIFIPKIVAFFTKM